MAAVDLNEALHSLAYLENSISSVRAMDRLPIEMIQGIDSGKQERVASPLTANDLCGVTSARMISSEVATELGRAAEDEESQNTWARSR